MKHISPAIIAVTGGGAIALLAAIFGFRRAAETEKKTAEAVVSGGDVPVRLTTYYPYKAGLTEAQRRMEGGVRDRKRRPIITLEQHLADPARYPYVSVAGDFNIWPDGQRLSLREFPGAVLRVVDTGGRFFGAGKVFRVAGREPLDIAVNDDTSRKSLKIPNLTEVRVVRGDNFAGGKAVAFGKLPGGTKVTGNFDDGCAVLGAVES